LYKLAHLFKAINLKRYKLNSSWVDNENEEEEEIGDVDKEDEVLIAEYKVNSKSR
jgi:hypothetical protein